MGTVSPRMKKNPQHHKAKFNEGILALNNYLALPMNKIIICMECIWLINDLLLLALRINTNSATKEEIPQNKSPMQGQLTQQNLLQEKNHFTYSNAMKMKLCRVDKNVFNKEFLDARLEI
jgi:hypothetical protein